ncbi:putative prohibitin family protein [Toxoplasma gondii RUB]|uniref:Prohibitin family protein, putative n=12 Tax=Toxoplasma gondii TaxID=5811 RepID=A0A125YGC3_TOXGV|nr:putative prohibitin family protein [Toxoplasma gondii GT1]ESS30047.1 putative prohibitin family protein [Toxoplasma gondii VEG]KAF4645597.1 putative prohibitin family protein [Toxoplasma gondii]KFG41520.1 putative prohibitin family protein [Toxoplasma gondii GAB2-2007-GAL-DOM2]KFG47536.1 putative prohibitin family protein [Toxoplasma gondii FOU]KFG61113.1 putative prohibitin family protein [Toxoplasma gondii RUB]KFH03657.1 putative prohibitin family protein [Toxoplasma gondii VAND]KFH1453
MAAQGGRSAWRAVASSFSRWCRTWDAEKRANARVLVGSLLLAGAAWSCGKRVPGGYVGFIQYRDGSVTPYLWEEQAVFPFLPYFQKPVTMRVLPAYKKMSKILTTKDGKEIEAAVKVRLQPKVAFVPELYLRFGREFGRAFLHQELSIDLRSVVKEHSYASLINNDEETDRIVDEIVERFQDAAAFHKVIITEISVVFRNPDDDDENEAA